MTSTVLSRPTIVSEIPAAKTAELVVIKTDLVCTEPLSIPDLFVPGGTDWLIELVENEVMVRSAHFDITTKSGQECIRRTADEIKAFRNKLDKFGAVHKADLMELPGIIDAERRSAKKRLETLEAGVLADLLEFEKQEKARVDALTARLSSLTVLTQSLSVLPVSEIERRCDQANDLYNDFDWQEYAEKAQAGYDDVVDQIDKAYTAAFEAEQVRIQQEAAANAEAERLRLIREEEIRKAAAAAAEQRRLDELAAAEKQRVAEQEASELRIKLQKERFETKRKADIEGQIAKIGDLSRRAELNQLPHYYSSRLTVLNEISTDFEFDEFTAQANLIINDVRKKLGSMVDTATAQKNKRDLDLKAAAELKAQNEVTAAAESERKRLEEHIHAQQEVQARRKANTELVKKVYTDIWMALHHGGVEQSQAKLCARIIMNAGNEFEPIPHLEVRY